MKDFVVVDIETTGLVNTMHDIIQIGACKVKNGLVDGSFDQFVKISGSIPYEVQQLTGIRDSDLEDANSIGEVLQEFIDFCEDLPFVCHNIQYDYNFLLEKSRICGLEAEFTRHNTRTGIDTLALCRKFYPNVSHRLGSMIEYLGITRLDGEYHNALYDAYMTKQLYTYLLSKYGAMFDVKTPISLGTCSGRRAEGEAFSFQ